MRDQRSPLHVDALDSPSLATPRTSVSYQPGAAARSSISSRACDSCRGRRRKCHFDDTSSPNAPAAASRPGSSQPQPQPQCYNCRRLGIACSFLLPSRPRGPKRRKRLPEYTGTVPVEGNGEPQGGRTNQRAGGQNGRPAALSNTAGFVLPGDVLPLPRAMQAASPFEAPRPVISASVFSPHAAVAAAAAAAAAAPSTAGPGFPTDELCSRALINILMADYLGLVYPLVPVVHRPSFRHDLANDRDVADPHFFALLVSLCALTVGLLPSRFRDYRAVDPRAGAHFATRTALINRCAEICTRQRTASYWDHVNHRKWAVSYVFSIACFQTGQVNRSRMFDVEYLQLARLLGLHRMSEYEGLNCIETQLRKKAFWLLFYGYAHTRVQSGRWERLTYFGPGEVRDINFEALLPLEVDDEQILKDRILDPAPPPPPPSATPHATPPAPGRLQPDQPPPGDPPFTLASGFILHSRVFLKGLRETMATVGCACELRRGPAARLARMRDLLHEMRYMLDDAPAPVRQWAMPEEKEGEEGQEGEGEEEEGEEGRPQDAAAAGPSTPRHDNGDGHGASHRYPEAVRGQHEIMRANIHVTHLWLQSLLLEQVDVAAQESAAASSSGADGASAPLRASWAERENICRQMLHLLHSIPHVYLEPNGLHLAYKIRDVAVTLLNCPFEAHTRPARRAAEYMRDFTRALSRLDRSETVNTNSLRSWVDADREPAASPPLPGV